VGEIFFSIREYLAKLQARTRLFRSLSSSFSGVLARRAKCMRCRSCRFADINVAQGSVATYARCSGIFSMHITANLSRNFPVKIFCKSVKI